MQTPIKAKHRILNSSYSPFTSLASSKISTNCDFDKIESNSISKKRFSRKRQNSDDSLRRFKTSQTEQKVLKRQHIQTPQNVEDSSLNEFKILPKLNFKKDSILTSRYVKMPTERTQMSQDFSKYNNVLNNKGSMTSRQIYRKEGQRQNCNTSITEEATQLQMKNNQLMILQDENGWLRKDLKVKQNHIQKLQKEKKQLNHEIQQINRMFKQKIRKLQIEIQQKDKQISLKTESIKDYIRIIEKGNQNLKKSEMEVDLLKIHLQQVIAKKVSKENLDIISYRELSLQNQLNHLRQEFNLLKTEQHKYLENELIQIKQQLQSVCKDHQNLSIANRMLIKKNQDLDVSIKKKYQKQLTEIKQKVKQLMKQSSNLKKQNVSLRKTIHQQKTKIEPNTLKQTIKRPNRLITGIRKPGENSRQNESDESFTISLSK